MAVFRHLVIYKNSDFGANQISIASAVFVDSSHENLNLNISTVTAFDADYRHWGDRSDSNIKLRLARVCGHVVRILR